MVKKIFLFSLIFGFVFSAAPVFATPAFLGMSLSTAGTNRTLMLPASADNSPVISLGSAVDPGTGKVVQGYAIVHYAKPDGAGGGKGGGTTSSTCFGFLAKGAKWKTVEPWVVNTANTRNLDGAFVFSNLVADVEKWEDAADGTVGDTAFVNILGDGAATAAALVADTSAPDNVNEVYFADIANSNAIAVTIVWGYFGGPPFARELVEWDMIFDDTTFDWSATGEAGKMDFENIATHELGHSVGLADLYEAYCGEETMYGYAANGETKKQTLAAGDIAGVSALY